MKTFLDITKDEIANIINIAMDDGEWHTPFAHDINIHELSNAKASYGWCNISKHNTYHDKEVWFNINANTVKIWEKKYGGKGKADISIYRSIHNLKQLAELLGQFDNKR